MAYKMLAIFMILVSWSTMLYASSQDCSGYKQPLAENQYEKYLPEIEERTKRSCTTSNIKCLMVTSVEHDKQYCALLQIPAGGNKITYCKVVWGSSGHGASSACSTAGKDETGGGGETIMGQGGSGTPLGGNGAKGNNFPGGKGFPFGKGGSPFGRRFPFNK